MSNGNSGFTKIYSANNQFSTLTVGDLNASNVDATIINGAQYITVTGYSSTAFATAAINAYEPLLTVPGQTAPATTATDTRLLRIPANSVITSIVASNNGVPIANAGPGTYSVGGFVTTGVFAPALTNALLTASTLANVNAICSRETQANAAANAATGIALPVFSTVDNFICVRTLVGANTTGSFKVRITYYTVTA